MPAKPKNTPRGRRTIRPMSTWRPIIEEVSASHGMNPKDVMCGWKSVRAVAARHEIFWRLNQRGVALSEIGRRLGGYDHTTVRHGVRKWAERIGAGGSDGRAT